MTQKTYQSHGCYLFSDTPLWGLTLASGIDPESPCISIESCSPEPSRPAHFAQKSENEQVSPRQSKRYRLGRYQLNIDFQEHETGFVLRFLDVADFHVSHDGRTVSYRAEEDALPSLLQELLTGCILSFCLALQGAFPLHGGAVVSDGVAVGFIGPAGHGKSSLIATCISHGWRLLSDGMVVLQEHGQEFWVQTGNPLVRLRPDATDHLIGSPGFFRSSSLVESSENPKQHVDVGTDWGELADQGYRLAGLYLLEPSEECTSPSLVSCTGWDAVSAIMANTYTVHIHPKSLSVSHFQFAARLLGSVPLKQLRYPRRLEFLPQMFETVRQDAHHLARQKPVRAVDPLEATQ